MFSKILIANRGEIAVRIIRACRGLGVRAVAIYSEADRDALHVRLADEAWPCGGAHAGESYLDADRVIEVAKRAGVDAVHPGYGFLSENAEFAEACARAGLVFIGPAPGVLRDMGDKITSRRAMQTAGVPIVPGTTEALGDEQARSVALEIGLPVMVKASAGGGGRGLRLVSDEAELDAAIERARSEALSAFGDGSLYVEKALSGPRHIEVQILADAHGHVLHLGERECSVQRRHQKLIEEAPANRLSDGLRSALHRAAVAAARAVGYCGAGTVEFLVDAAGDFFFLEMNTRIQVEHPVTEAVTGIDLVAEMIRVASGEPVSFSQDEVVMRGHAIEARIYAEDPDKGFMPSPGRITHWRTPDGAGVRVDAGVEAGSDVPMFYDPMVAKLVVWGAHRDEAVQRLQMALGEFLVGGIRTSLPFHLRAVASEAFVRGEYDTGFVDAHLPAPTAPDAATHALYACIARLELSALGQAPAEASVHLSARGQTDHAVRVQDADADAVPARRRVVLDGEARDLDARRVLPGLWSLVEDGTQREVLAEPRGKSGIDLVSRGVRHSLKWKLG